VPSRAIPTRARAGSKDVSATRRALSSIVEEALRTPGDALPPETASEMRARFGHDFSRVRVHQDVEAARFLNAEAFTIGQHIFFAPGAYAPFAPRGQSLLVHELAHTVQHGPAAPAAPWRVSRGGDALESEADRASACVLDGRTRPAITQAPVAGLISRKQAVETETSGTDFLVSLTMVVTFSVRADPDKALDARADAISEQFQADPDDRTGRVRRQLQRLTDKSRYDLLDRIRTRLTAANWERLQQVLKLSLPSDSERDTVAAAVPELTERTPDMTAPQPAPAATEPEAGAPGKSKPTAAPEISPQEELDKDKGPEGDPKKIPVDAKHAERTAKEKRPQPPGVKPQPKPAAATSAAPPAAPSGGEAAAAPAAVQEAAPLGAAPGEAAPEAVPGGEGAVAPREAAAAESPTLESPAAEGAGMEGPATTPEAGEVAATGQAPAAGPADASEPATSIPSSGPAPDTGPEKPPEEAAIDQIPDPSSEEKKPEPNPSAPAQVPDEQAAPSASSPPAPAPSEPATAVNSAPALAAGGPEAAAATGGFRSPESSDGSGGPAAPPAAEPERSGAPEEIPAPVEEAVAGPEPIAAPENPQPQAGDAASPQSSGCEGGGGAPAAEGEGGAAAGPCGGGGGGGTEEPKAEAAPDVAQSDPPAAMGSVANLPPAQLQTALGGVSASSSNAVKAQKEELKANPPSMERPSGVPAQRDPTLPVTPPPLPSANDPSGVERAKAGAALAVPQPEPLPAPPPPPTQGLKGPQLPGDAEMSKEDVARAQGAVDSLPTSDPALNVTAGDPPSLELAGDADPKATAEQKANLDKTTAAAHAQGQHDVAAPMGENNIYPTVPQEKMQAQVDGEGGPGVMGTLAACAKGGSAELAKARGGGGAAADTADETVSIVAKEQKGDEIKGAALKAQGDMQAKQQENAEKVADEKAKSQEAVEKEIADNAAEQKNERTKAREESIKTRGEWNKDQQKLVVAAQTDSDKTTSDASAKIATKQKESKAEASSHIEDGNKKAADARRDAENEAQEKKKEAKKESGGFFSWLSSKVSAFFNKIKEAIHAAFEAARKLVKAAIEAAKKLAVAVIEKARQFVVAAIKAAGDVLIAIGDRVLAGFPGLRDKFRKFVKDRVDKAVSAVNKLADDLKKGVQKLLDMLGSALNGLLGLLECAYMAAVDAVAGVVQSAINAAKAFVDALAVFGVLIKDIAAGPGRWLSNLGKAVVDGIKNCLWGAFKAAVKNWFNQKLEEVLGLGLAIWNLLFKGCLKMKDIAKMAWEGLISAIPMILIQLLIEKLVAMIVPAAGAILTIIEGLRAAWGTVSRIIAAIGLFIAFLKAVKSGNAAGPFATALAAAAIVVIDFVANWLIQRLRKPAGAISGRLKAFAQKIAAMLKKGVAALKKGAKAVGGALKRAAVAVGRAVKRGAAAVGRGLKKAGAAIAKSRVFQAIAKSKVGKALIQAGQKVKGAWNKGKEAYVNAKAKLKAKWDKWKEKRKKDKAQRIERAKQAIRTKLARSFERGVSRLRLKAQLALWRVYYGFSQLSLQGSHANPQVFAEASPGEVLLGGQSFDRVKVLQILNQIARDRSKRVVGRTEVAGAPLALRPGEDPGRLGAILAGRSKAQLPGWGQTVPFDIGGEQVFGSQRRGTANVMIRGLGTYPEIEEKFRAQGLSGQALSRQVSETIRTGKGPLDVKRLITLQSVESARMPLANVATPLSMIGMERELLTTSKAFGAPGVERPYGGGDYPPSQVGAVKSSVRATKRAEGADFRPGTEIHKASEEQLRRYFDLLAAVTQEMIFNDEEHMRRKVEQLLAKYERTIGAA
jgi:hypothetical protein